MFGWPEEWRSKHIQSARVSGPGHFKLPFLFKNMLGNQTWLLWQPRYTCARAQYCYSTVIIPLGCAHAHPSGWSAISFSMTVLMTVCTQFPVWSSASESLRAVCAHSHLSRRLKQLWLERCEGGHVRSPMARKESRPAAAATGSARADAGIAAPVAAAATASGANARGLAKSCLAGARVDESGHRAGLLVLGTGDG